MPNKSEAYQLNILNILEEDDLGLSISQIAEKINLNRNSTAKYLEIMVEKELIYKREQGPTQKLFYPVRRSKSFEARADAMVKFYQTLHSSVFFELLGDPKKAQEIGYKMAKKGVTALYTKQFANYEFTFKNVVHFIGIAVGLTYPTPIVKTRVHRNPKDKKSFILEIKNCICDGVKEYKSICEIQTGLFKGVIEDLIAPQKVKVEEIECRINGHVSCKYLITKIVNSKD
ncbi:MAG: V4R domain-containing protein [Promethearchaeota archaeon]